MGHVPADGATLPPRRPRRSPEGSVGGIFGCPSNNGRSRPGHRHGSDDGGCRRIAKVAAVLALAVAAATTTLTLHLEIFRSAARRPRLAGIVAGARKGGGGGGGGGPPPYDEVVALLVASAATAPGTAVDRGLGGSVPRKPNSETGNDDRRRTMTTKDVDGEERSRRNQRPPPPRASTELSPHASELLRTYDPDEQVPAAFWNCSAHSPSLDSSTRNGSTALASGDDRKGKKKLIFVHVYKTAGSSIRGFLKSYGRYCRRSVAILYGCSGIASSTLNETVWRERKKKEKTTASGSSKNTTKGVPDGKSCSLSHASDGADAYGAAARTGGTFGRELYDRSDVVGGHLPLGVHQRGGAGGDDDDYDDVRYLTFVRDPLDKYVSGKLYANRRRNWTAEDAIKRISYEISHLYRKGGRYEKYSTYLLTPYQKEGTFRGEDEKVQTIQSNLAGMRVVVGVVERMAESYELLQRVLDGAGELDRAFQLLRSNALVKNRSALSTTDIVRRLKARDPDFYRQARVVLVAEYDVYDFAVKLHEAQYRRLVVPSSGR